MGVTICNLQKAELGKKWTEWDYNSLLLIGQRGLKRRSKVLRGVKREQKGSRETYIPLARMQYGPCFCNSSKRSNLSPHFMHFFECFWMCMLSTSKLLQRRLQMVHSYIVTVVGAVSGACSRRVSSKRGAYPSGSMTGTGGPGRTIFELWRGR